MERKQDKSHETSNNHECSHEIARTLMKSDSPECEMGEISQQDVVLRSSHEKRAENTSKITELETKNENRELEHQNSHINPANKTKPNKWMESFHFVKRNSNVVPLNRK